MPPSVDWTACWIPWDLALPCPVLPCHTLSGFAVHTVGAAAARYFWKLLDVPDESDRKKTVIGVLGRLAPLLMALMAGSFQVLIWPRKIFAMTSGVRTSLSTPLSL